MARSRCDQEAFEIIDGLFTSGLPSFDGGRAELAAAEGLLDALIRLDFAGSAVADLSGLWAKGDIGQLVAATVAVAQKRWQAGRLGFDEGAALFTGLERLLRQAEAGASGAGVIPSVGRVLLVVPEREVHHLGPRLLHREMVASGLTAELVLDQPAEHWLERVAGEAFDVVALSIGHDALLAEAADWVQRLRLASCQSGLRIMVGGAAITAGQGAYGFVSADLVTNDVVAALAFVDGARRRPERAN